MACIKAHRTYLASSSSDVRDRVAVVADAADQQLHTPEKGHNSMHTSAATGAVQQKNGRSRRGRGLGVLSWESWRSAKAGARRDSRRAQVASRRPLPRAIFFPLVPSPFPSALRGAGWADGRRPSVALAVRLVRCGRGW